MTLSRGNCILRSGNAKRLKHLKKNCTLIPIINFSYLKLSLQDSIAFSRFKILLIHILLLISEAAEQNLKDKIKCLSGPKQRDHSLTFKSIHNCHHCISPLAGYKPHTSNYLCPQPFFQLSCNSSVLFSTMPVYMYFSDEKG